MKLLFACLLSLCSFAASAAELHLLTDDHPPLVWRGPLVSADLRADVPQTARGGLGHLVVEMRPGTGDIPRSLAQRGTVAG